MYLRVNFEVHSCAFRSIPVSKRTQQTVPVGINKCKNRISQTRAFRNSCIWNQFYLFQTTSHLPGRVGQSVTCLATDACLTADPGVASSIPVRSHTFVEIDHEIISTVILLPSTDLFKKGFCQLQAKVCARITG